MHDASNTVCGRLIANHAPLSKMENGLPGGFFKPALANCCLPRALPCATLPRMNEIRIHKWHFKLPQSRALRILLGILLIIGGIFGFLPILGFWMIPLGLTILSFEIPMVRRWRRRFVVWFSRWWHKRRPSRERNKAQKMTSRADGRRTDDKEVRRSRQIPAPPQD